MDVKGKIGAAGGMILRGGTHMKLSRLNLLTALVSLAGALIFLWLGSAVVALLWLAITVVWLALALRAAGRSDVEDEPFRRLARRIYRLLLYGS